MKHTAVALMLLRCFWLQRQLWPSPNHRLPQLTYRPWSCRTMHMRRFLSRPCPNPRKTLALRIPIGPTRPGTHLERRRRADCGSSGPPRSHPYFCRTLDARARRAAHGTNIKCLASIDLTRPNKCNHRDGNTRDSRECTVKSAGHHGPIVSE
jgi:hypothetical protein